MRVVLGVAVETCCVEELSWTAMSSGCYLTQDWRGRMRQLMSRQICGILSGDRE